MDFFSLFGENLTVRVCVCGLQDTSRFATWLNREKLVKIVQTSMKSPSSGDEIHLIDPLGRVSGNSSRCQSATVLVCKIV